jgi:hypothetical protein
MVGIPVIGENPRPYGPDMYDLEDPAFLSRTHELWQIFREWAQIQPLSLTNDGFHLMIDRGVLEIGLSLACQRGSPSSSAFWLTHVMGIDR